jgi:hypothetical protein
MTFKRLKFTFLLIASLVVLGENSYGLGISDQKQDSTWNDWNFRISPFFWYIGFKGTIYRPPQPVQMPEPPPPKYEIDVGFNDIKNSIKFALMLAGQYRNEHIVTQFNFSSLILESEAITPLELLLKDNIINLKYFGGDLGLGYRVVKKPKFEFDVLLGVKFVYFDIGLTSKVAGTAKKYERSQLWIDSSIGTNLKYRPHHRIEFYGYADYGPPVIDKIDSYQFMAGASYLISRTVHLSLGYRLYHLDFPKEESIYVGDIKGWIMRLGFQF